MNVAWEGVRGCSALLLYSLASRSTKDAAGGMMEGEMCLTARRATTYVCMELENLKSKLGSSTREAHKSQACLFPNLGDCFLSHKTRTVRPEGESRKVSLCISMLSLLLKNWALLCICCKGSSNLKTAHPESTPKTRRAVVMCKHGQRYGARHFLIYGVNQILNKALIQLVCVLIIPHSHLKQSMKGEH